MTDTRERYLIEPEVLAARLGDPDLRVFDAAVTLERSSRGYRALSGRAEYEAEHIPGAGFMDLIEHLSDTTTGLGFTLPEVPALAAAVGELGISRKHPVVLYSSGHMMWATRAFWLLDYLGHEQVRVLNGGMARWRAAGLPLISGAEAYAPTHFEPAPRLARFVRLEEMSALVEAGQTCTLNALAPEVYSGEAVHYGRPGHIPGSFNLHYDNLLEAGCFQDDDRLREQLAAVGAAGQDRLVAYCGGGISATIPAFARLLVGLNDTAVYDGSMSEWVRAERPLTTGARP